MGNSGSQPSRAVLKKRRPRLGTSAGQRQNICQSCTSYEEDLLDQLAALSTSGGPSRPIRKPLRHVLQEDFSRLEVSAEAGCHICLVWLEALLRCCHSKGQSQDLRCSSGAVTAGRLELSRVNAGFSIEVSCGRCAVHVALDPSNAGGIRSIPHSVRESQTRQLNEWMYTCDHDHQCSQRLRRGRPPKRLLRHESGTASIVDGDSTPENRRYVALSYCWGAPAREEQKKGLRLTRDTIARLEQGVPVQELSAAIRDAVEMIHMLRIPYLWVDALCILQDPLSTEFEEEARRMHEIYGLAAFTLSVCSSESADMTFLDNCSVGQESTRVSFAGHSLQLPNLSFDDTYNASPTALRGWIFQEEILSTRLVYWTYHAVYWSCEESTKIEESKRDLWDSYVSARPMSLYTNPQPLLLWYDMVEKFSKRQFTYASDRLPALSGLAAILEERIGDTYHLGMWSGQLPASLLWEVADYADSDETAAHAMPGVPSWSWASTPPTRQITFPPACHARPKSRVLEFLGVNGDIMRVQGRLKPLTHGLRATGWPGVPLIQQQPASPGVIFPCLQFLAPGYAERSNGLDEEVVVSRDAFRPQFVVRYRRNAAQSAREVLCLKVTGKAILLLKEAESSSSDVVGVAERTYERVGCCTDCPDKGFFNDATETTLRLK